MCSKHPRGEQGWCAGPEVEAKWNAACQQREEAMRHLLAKPLDKNLRKTVKKAGKTFRDVSKSAVMGFFWNFVRKLETRAREGG